MTELGQQPTVVPQARKGPEAVPEYDIIDPSILALAGHDVVTDTVDGPETLELTDALEEASDQERTGWRRAMHLGKRAVQSTIITLEVLPTNGAITYGVPLSVYAATRSVPAAMASAGILTAGLEGLGGTATADILSNSPNSKLVNKVQDLLDSRAVRSLLASQDGRISPLAEGVTALYGGAPAAMLARESEPDADERTQAERRRYGLRTAAALGIICTAQMGLYTSGIEGLLEGKPDVYLPVAALAAGVGGGIEYARRRVRAEKRAQESEPRYDLSEKEMELLERDLLEDLEKQLRPKRRLSKERRNYKLPEKIYAVWLDPDSRYANVVRTREAELFPEVKELPPEIEADTKFVAFVDTRKGKRRIVHATTISGVEQGPKDLDRETHTGFTTIDDLIDMGNFTAQDFRNYYAEKKIDLDSSVSIDTNFRVGEWVKDFEDINVAFLAYVTIFKILERRRPEVGDAGAFCSINQKSIDSFISFGLDCELLMGRQDFTTSEAARGEQYLPAVVRVDDSTRAVFDGLVDKIEEVTLEQKKPRRQRKNKK
ncbi:MAG: hypothetical protein WCJ24_03170 [Candidatus Saccharibacteria bacterium]